MHYSALKKKLRDINPEVITVDIFDTLLLRKWQPENWRFYKLSKIQSNILNKSGFRVTAMLLFTQRNYFGKILRSENLKNGLDYETSLHKIFDCIIKDLSIRQKVKLTKFVKSSIIQKLIAEELNFEKPQLYPNNKLVKLLKNLIKKNKKIYFVSDMYLDSAEIKKLLNYHNIKFLKGGISSADNMVGKHSGRSFALLSKKYKNFNLTSTLHIGDHRVGDGKNPKQVGCNSFWLFMPIHRFKLFIGKFIFSVFLKVKILNENKKQFYYFGKSSKISELENQQVTTYQQSVGLGWVFAPAIIFYLQQLHDRTVISGATPVFITSESKTFLHFYKLLGFGEAKTLPGINRNKMIQAYAKILYDQNVSFMSILEMAKKILRRKTNSSALVTLGISKIESQKWNIIGLKQTRQELKKLSLESVEKKWSNELKSIISSYRNLSKNNSKNIVLADVGWNDTIQILFTEVLKEKNMPYKKLRGLYMAKTGTNIFNSKIITNSEGIIFNSLTKKYAKYLYQPEVWESFLNSDNLDSETRNNIITGIEQCIEYFKNSQITAEQLYKITQPQLYKTLKNPSKITIETMANLKFDYGTLDESICPLVNLNQNQIKIYYWLFIKPSKFKDFYFHQGWKWGSATYYHYKLAYRLWRFKTKKPSF